MLHIYKAISGLNGRVSFITRKKNNKKQYIFFLEVPVTRNIEQLKQIIASNKYNVLSDSTKVVLEPLNNGTTIHILKGILISSEIKRDITSKLEQLLQKLIKLINMTK